MMNEVSVDRYSEFYQEIYRIVDNPQITESLWEAFRGLTITFPKRLYSKEYVYAYIAENYGKEKVQIIARHLELSERRIRQIASEIRSNKISEKCEGD